MSYSVVSPHDAWAVSLEHAHSAVLALRVSVETAEAAHEKKRDVARRNALRTARKLLRRAQDLETQIARSLK